MTLLLTVVFCVVGVLAATLLVLARVWSRTPHGRLKPIFALAFRLMPLLDRAGADRAIGATDMSTAEKRAAARRRFLESTASLAAPEPFAGSIEDRSLASGPSGEVGVRIYRPQNEAPLPLILYAHGGGFVVGSPDYTDVVCRILAHATPAVVVSVDYRLAPEHRCPAAVDDAVAVLGALGERGRVVGLFGESAGGGLAVAAAVALREADRPLPGRLGLLSPWVDLTCSGDTYRTLAAVDPDFPDPADPPRWAAAYAGDHPGDPAASPLFADLAGLPPTLIQVGGREILCSDSCRLAGNLRDAGVDAVLDVWDGLWHVWHLFPVPEAARALAELIDFLEGAN